MTSCLHANFELTSHTASPFEGGEDEKQESEQKQYRTWQCPGALGAWQSCLCDSVLTTAPNFENEKYLIVLFVGLGPKLWKENEKDQEIYNSFHSLLDKLVYSNQFYDGFRAKNNWKEMFSSEVYRKWPGTYHSCHSKYPVTKWIMVSRRMCGRHSLLSYNQIDTLFFSAPTSIEGYSLWSLW